MKYVNKHEVKSQIKEKSVPKKVKKKAIVLESIQPEPLSSFTQIPLNKEKKDVLIAESEEMSMIVLKAILEKNDFTFELAKTESEALIAFDKYQFRIVLIGTTVTNSWNSLVDKIWQENNKVPVSFLMALTLTPEGSDYADFLNNNFDKIIIKPYKESELVRILKKYRKLIPKRKNPKNHYTFKLDQLLRISNNNEEFVKTMLGKFIETAQECESALNKFLVPFNSEEMKRAAHKGIPSYSVLELKELANLLIYFERNQFSEKDLNDLSEKISFFSAKNQQVISEIKKFLRLRK
ncbi:MAG: signal transduction histidine kinase [Bacteroidota bacterium]|jgi:DNA-binding response OmpR family regulator|nr:signal transduction histidine kinase [Bacteroidota bacterium]